MKISGFRLHDCRNGAHIQFVSEILEIALDDANVRSRCDIYVRDLKGAVARQKSKFGISLKSFHSDTIAQADKMRSRHFMAIKKIVAIYCTMPDIKSEIHSARLLNQLIKDARVKTRDDLDTKTGMFNKLIQMFEGDYENDIKVLHLTKFVDKMRDANDVLMEATEQRINEKIAHEPKAMKKARAVTNHAYRELMKAVNAFITLEGDEDFAPFVDRVNQVIARYKKPNPTPKPKGKDGNKGKDTKTDITKSTDE